jgi:hypothetical protein
MLDVGHPVPLQVLPAAVQDPDRHTRDPIRGHPRLDPGVQLGKQPAGISAVCGV